MGWEGGSPFSYRTRQMSNGEWFAEAKRGSFSAAHILDEPLDADCWFAFGVTEEEALRKVLAETTD